ncbi:MAG: DUF3179 domain-containing protein [Rhodospirillales bacterium]|nr:DUF3179 domain-containing protein [Rhodospirillales bacterium]
MNKNLVPIYILAAFVFLALADVRAWAASYPESWDMDWSKTDFSKTSIDLSEIFSGGPAKDGIPSIDQPSFLPVSEIDDLGPQEPVIALHVNGEARAYPLRIMMWHEIVNDSIGGVPVTVTYCPLCNSSIVFERQLDGVILDFGTTGKLRNSDLVMYDRQTESWWQQFLGEAIVGSMTGKTLKVIPSRLESFERFMKRAPYGKVLIPGAPNMRHYGANPYVGYDSRDVPYGFFRGELPEGIDAMVRVIVVNGEAWSLPLLSKAGVINAGGGLEISWQVGQNSALDSNVIANGRDVGNIVVRQRQGDQWRDVAHDITFAFVFNAFHPGGVIHQ